MIVFRFVKAHNFLSKLSISLLCLFLLFFPKGGIKIGALPITWGYALLGLFSLILIFRPSHKISMLRLISCLALVPFQLLSIFSITIYGHETLEFTISFFISFIVLPMMFYLLFSESIERLDMLFFLKWVRTGVFFIAVYGIFLFFYKFLTGKFIELPFLTVNFHDLGQLEEKNINRGFVFKLISTYNNGNLYGVAVLLLLPLYQVIEKSKLKQLLVKELSLLLTFLGVMM